MAKSNKINQTTLSVADFINHFVENDQKKADSFELIKLMKEWSGFEPKMWGSSIIGFGSYHYKYASGHEGDAPIIGFSPRKAAFSLYIFSPTPESEVLIAELGKIKIAKACIYTKKLADVNISVLEKICKQSIAYITENHKL
jgi:hypothetical protein